MTEQPADRPRVLADHVRKGKRFIPPLALRTSEISWIREIVPEVFWLGLLNAFCGWKRGAELAVAVARSAQAQVSNDGSWFAFASDYTSLDDRQRGLILGVLGQSGVLPPVAMALDLLLSNYPRCPLGFLKSGRETEPMLASGGLDTLKEVLFSLFDRSSIEATQAQANVLYVGFATGRLFVKEGLALANFPAIQLYPSTDESRKIAAGVRASVSAFAGEKAATPWPAYFWNRGLELEPCELPEDSEDGPSS